MKKLVILAAGLAGLPTAANAAVMPDLAFLPSLKVHEIYQKFEQKTIYAPIPKHRERNEVPSATKRGSKNSRSAAKDFRKA